MLKKIFCNRRVLVISDDDIKSYPLNAKSQSLIIIGLLSFISWVSFSSGKYFTFKQLISAKEAEVYQANLINLDLQTKIDSLQGNLVKLNEYFDTVKEFDYNKDELGDKRSKLEKKEKITYKINEIDSPFGNLKNSSKRISGTKKEKIVEDINSNTIVRINSLKEIIAITGLSINDFNVTDKNTKKVVEKLFNSSNSGGPVTDNITGLTHDEEQINLKLNFSENIEELMYIENFFNSIPIGSPMKRYYISSRYGKRYDPFTKREANHYGTDFAGPYGAEIYSTAPGIVKFSGRKGSYGKFIEIDHGFGIVTRYGHLSKLSVKKGERISRGDIIAKQGNTGRSSGHHLHYEVKLNDKFFNPEKFLKAGKYVF